MKDKTKIVAPRPEPVPDNPEYVKGYRPNVEKLNPDPPQSGSGVPPTKPVNNGK